MKLFFWWVGSLFPGREECTYSMHRFVLLPPSSWCFSWISMQPHLGDPNRELPYFTSGSKFDTDCRTLAPFQWQYYEPAVATRLFSGMTRSFQLSKERHSWCFFSLKSSYNHRKKRNKFSELDPKFFKSTRVSFKNKNARKKPWWEWKKETFNASFSSIE